MAHSTRRCKQELELALTKNARLSEKKPSQNKVETPAPAKSLFSISFALAWQHKAINKARNTLIIVNLDKKINALEQLIGSHNIINHWRKFYSQGTAYTQLAEFKSLRLDELRERAIKSQALPLFEEIETLIQQHNTHVQNNSAFFTKKLLQYHKCVDQTSKSESEQQSEEQRQRVLIF